MESTTTTTIQRKAMNQGLRNRQRRRRKCAKCPRPRLGLHIWLALIVVQAVSSTWHFSSLVHNNDDDGQTTEREILQLVKTMLSNPLDTTQVACRSNGQCPFHTTCGVRSAETNHSAAVEDDKLPGTCQAVPIVAADKQVPTYLADCLDACQRELELDERFLHHSVPRIVQRHPTNAQPRGCALDFERTSVKETTTSREPPWEAPRPVDVRWEQTRFRHIVRVDPMVDDDDQVQWRAVCTAPCHDDAECQTTFTATPLPWTCVRGACQRNPQYWHNDETLVVVTGATLKDRTALLNLIASARYWASQHMVVVYLLGHDWTMAQKDQIRAWTNVESVEEWREDQDHSSQGMVKDALQRFSSSVFWLDPTTTLAGPLKPVETILQRNGVFWADPKAYAVTANSRYTTLLHAAAMILPHHTEYVATTVSQVAKDRLKPSYRFVFVQPNHRYLSVKGMYHGPVTDWSWPNATVPPHETRRLWQEPRRPMRRRR